MKSRILGLLMVISSVLFCQSSGIRPSIPAVLGGQVSYDAKGVLTVSKNGEALPDLGKSDEYTLDEMLGGPIGTDTGIQLDFRKPELNGTVAYGPYVESARYPFISFLPKTVPIQKGRSLLEIKSVFVHTNDFFHFADTGRGILGYRVIDASGRLIYEGRIAFAGKGPYRVLPTIVEGPFVNILEPDSCILSFETNVPVRTSIHVDNRDFGDKDAAIHHEIPITGLKQATEYRYEISYGDRSEAHQFRSAAARGSRAPFTFAFDANNRATTGGGERDLGEVNYSSARASIAAALLNHAVFMQTMGGNSTGNNTSIGGHLLEHANWKRAYEPFWSEIPVYVGMGNHESNYFFMRADKVSGKQIRIERFPYDTESGPAIFAQAFVNPRNGPESEDGAPYDPDPTRQDFPPYKENVYYYTYGNLAMIVLNSEYWKSSDASISGAPEGYVMDQQLKWLDETIQKLERDATIDHIFINLHSCLFPNGNHTDAGMWYDGSNDPRPMVAGVRVDKGIIERRDELIDVSINRSKKVIGFLVGSEHNFAFLKITPSLSIYPAGYSRPKLKIRRDFYYINNGGGGVYSYSLLHNTPWADQFQYFTVPPTLALFDVDGKSVFMRVMNPETFEVVAGRVRLR